MSSKSPGFIRRCLNLFVAKALQSWRMCEVISDGFLCLSHLGLYNNLGLKRCPFKWQRPVSNPVIILSWCLLRLSNSPAFFHRGFFLKKALNVPCPCMDWCSLFSTCPVPDHPVWQPLQIHHVQAVVLLVDMKSLVLSFHQLSHFHQFECVLAPIQIGSCYVLPISPWTDGSPKVIWNFIWKLLRALMAACLLEKNRCSYLCNPLLYAPLYMP